MSSSPDPNRVELLGKLSRVGRLTFTPSGLAVLEGLLAVRQTRLDRESMGYFGFVIVGEQAIELQAKLAIGRNVKLLGSLFQRNFRNRSGTRVSEITVLVKEAIVVS